MLWSTANFVMLSLLVLGHSTLWITFVNRTHALRLREPALRQFRHLHDVAIVLFPIILFWMIGWNGPRLLRGGSWHDVSLLWQIILGLCTLGLAWLIFTVARLRFHRARQREIPTKRTVHDIAAKLGHRPTAPGPYFHLTRLPYNEQFRVEVVEKTLTPARLPKVWNGLSILHLSDWHLQGTVTRDYFESVCRIAAETPHDLICFTGDLVDNLAQLDWLPETLGKLEAPLGKFFILGNHDWYLDPGKIRAALAALGWTDVGSKTEAISHRGLTLEVGGDETPWLGTAPTFNDAADFRLLLSHTPDNIPRARRQQIDLMLSGHNHGGQIQLPYLGPIYSPSWYGCKYAGGTFFETPTLLHVSRGLSGRHPLRWHCLPEITRFTLRTDS